MIMCLLLSLLRNLHARLGAIAPESTHAHSNPRISAALARIGRGFKKLAGVASYTEKSKMTGRRSRSPVGPPSSVLQRKIATESSPTDRVERLLRKYKVEGICKTIM